MKALSLTQPWATLIAVGAKRIETRSWRPSTLGEIAIHAAKGFPGWAKDFCNVPRVESALWTPEQLGPHRLNRELIEALPRMAIIGTAQIVSWKPTGPTMFASQQYEEPAEGTLERLLGDYSPNRFMWFLENVRALKEPIPCRGALGLWDVPAEVEAQIREHLSVARAA